MKKLEKFRKELLKFLKDIRGGAMGEIQQRTEKNVGNWKNQTKNSQIEKKASAEKSRKYRENCW